MTIAKDLIHTLAAMMLYIAAPAIACAQAQPPPEPAQADSQGPDYHAKLTFAGYRAGGEFSGDVNLRYTVGEWTGWAGYFATEEGFPIRQGRVGIEYDWKTPWLFLVPSAQKASDGFYGGSIYSEIGPTVYAIAGVSRTNLGPYANLTFDPNDSWQLGAGVHFGAGDTAAIYTVWDNRLNTGQQITHAVVKHHWQAYRITVDVSYKSGHGDDNVYLRGGAVAIEYDWKRWFVKGAVDQHVNFSEPTMTRLGGGVRF